ncbi:TPA_asm: hypothetical protein [ssRNA phage ESO000]|uniref:Uncharacterized protein n=1 Tax=ssRNA phage ESO000 TaxID=2786007 RepID=A0A8S5KXZ4_9VIRU|nr:hypothetical protein QIS14_gp3 [ssRNA phage ESO000]DAD49917.1 TPA_asm: hypothetical protein [ssRNA phage ESO000]
MAVKFPWQRLLFTVSLAALSQLMEELSKKISVPLPVEDPAPLKSASPSTIEHIDPFGWPDQGLGKR